MQTTEKTCRYSHIFKNLGIVYLLFLALGAWLIFSFDGDMIFLFALIGIGVAAAIIYVTTSVTISNDEISVRTLLGSKVLRWSEIGAISSKRSSFTLTNRDGDVTLRVNSRLDGYVTIFDLLYQKRADLFEYERHNPFSRSVTSNIATVTLRLLLLVVTLIYFIFRKESSVFDIIYIVIGIESIYGLVSWFFSPQSIILNLDSITVKYFYKTDSCLIDDVASITARRGRGTINLKSKRKLTFSWSGFENSPYLVYYVILRWYRAYLAKMSNSPT